MKKTIFILGILVSLTCTAQTVSLTVPNSSGLCDKCSDLVWHEPTRSIVFTSDTAHFLSLGPKSFMHRYNGVLHYIKIVNGESVSVFENCVKKDTGHIYYYSGSPEPNESGIVCAISIIKHTEVIDQTIITTKEGEFDMQKWFEFIPLEKCILQ